MCIIAIKNKGVQFPDAELLETMWENNPDGAGIMWSHDGRVNIRKGFMTFESYYAFIEEWSKTHDTTQTPVVFHFRISTHAGVNPQCTHPFPVKNSKDALKKLELSTDLGVVHNGIIPIEARPGISDTMEYILDQLYYIKKMNRKFYKDENCCDLIKNAIHSKMAFLTAVGDIYTIGDFNEDEKTGMIYSNTSWQKRTYTPYLMTNYNYGNYADYESYSSPWVWDDDDYYYSTDAQLTQTMAVKQFNDVDFEKYTLHGVSPLYYDPKEEWIVFDRNGVIYKSDDGYTFKKMAAAYATDANGHPPKFNEREAYELAVCII